MNINAYLESRDLAGLDDETLGVIEEFIGGTHMALVAKSVTMSEEHNKWHRENTMTKREQFAGFALIGLATDVVNYTQLSDVKRDAYALADAMLGEEK